MVGERRRPELRKIFAGFHHQVEQVLAARPMCTNGRSSIGIR
jgi:hypothetical protein